MGEEIDMKKIAEEMEPKEKAAPKKSLEEIRASVVDQLKKGIPHRTLQKVLHDMGYTYTEVESILTEADIDLQTQMHHVVNLRVIGIAALILIILLAGFAFLGLTLTQQATDCTTPFCTEERVTCTPGTYSHSTGTTTTTYTVDRTGDLCSIAERIDAAPSTHPEQPGMSMACTFELMNGQVLNVNDLSKCTGELADERKAF